MMTRRQLTLEYDDETLNVTGSFDGDFIDQVSRMFEHLFDRGLLRVTVIQSYTYPDYPHLATPELSVFPPPEVTATVERRVDRSQTQLVVKVQGLQRHGD